jgi:hypothetical protein
MHCRNDLVKYLVPVEEIKLMKMGNPGHLANTSPQNNTDPFNNFVNVM